MGFEYSFLNLAKEPNAIYITNKIEKDENIVSKLIEINIDEIKDETTNEIKYNMILIFENELTTDEQNLVNNYVTESLDFVFEYEDALDIISKIYENATSQEMLLRLINTFNTYPIIKTSMDAFNYDLAWNFLNDALNNNLLTSDDITYLQNYIPTGDW